MGPSPPSLLDRRAEQPVRVGRPGGWCGNLIRPGGGGPGGRRVGGGSAHGEGLAPAFLPHSFNRSWGPRGSGGELCTAGARARRPSQRAGPGPGRGRFLPAALRATPCPPATMSDPAVNAQLDGIISDFEGGSRAALTSWAGPSGWSGVGREEAGASAGHPPAQRVPGPAPPTWSTRFWARTGAAHPHGAPCCVVPPEFPSFYCC